MPDELPLETFERLEALDLLLEESDLAIFECNTRLGILRSVIRRAEGRDVSSWNAEHQAQWFDARHELEYSKAILEIEKMTEAQNRAFLAASVVALLKGNGLWREPILPSGSKMHSL